MIVLGIETASRQVGCAIGGQEGIISQFHAAKGRRHAETLTPSIEFVRQQAQIELSEISVIAIDVGPGLFTGLRVGISAAKAMAQSLKVPMIGMSSLDLLVFPLRWSDRLIVPVMDAARREVFYGFYRQVSGGVQREGDLVVGTPDELANELLARNEEVLLVGDGALRYADAFTDIKGVEIGTTGNAYPSAASLVELAHPRALREEFVQPHQLEPVYLRKADAEINWEAGVGRYGGKR